MYSVLFIWRIIVVGSHIYTVKLMIIADSSVARYSLLVNAFADILNKK